jgi:hypothetical protein
MDAKRKRPLKRGVAALTLVASLAVVGACGADTPAAKDKSPGTSRTAASSTTSTAADSRSTAIPQPTAAQLAAAGFEKLPVAPESERVDRTAPPFSDPTNVTNPLFPISDLHSAILNGRVDGKPFRTETTLLPDTRIIEWTDGQRVETLVSQYVAYLDGRIQEAALDFYAQADDGSVWYFGEDVYNYNEDGLIADTAGTWLAGKEGPVAMIMPADPKVGDVHRPENIPGLVFEEVSVKTAGKTVDGPLGPVKGAMVGRELHDDGTYSDKVFAPGYGEFYSAHEGDVEALALAVPTDALSEPLPDEIRTLSSGAEDIFRSARSGEWKAASASIEEMRTAWDAYRQASDVPSRLDDPMSGALEALAGAVDARDPVEAGQATHDVAIASLDLQLRYLSPAETDLARFDVWTRRVLVDTAADDMAGVTGDLATLEWIRDRFADTLEGADLTRIDAHLEALRTTVDDEDLAAATDEAERLRDTLTQLRE